MPLAPLRGGEILPSPTFSLLAPDPFRYGIRPGRHGGVRLEIDPEPMLTTRGTRKVLIHNYGHGPAGITLSWGCADVVRQHVQDIIERELRVVPGKVRIAVAGAGVIGLTVAAELKRWRPALKVRVFAKTIGTNRQVNVRETTSWVAGGQFEPTMMVQEYRGSGSQDRLHILHDYVRRSAARIKTLKTARVQRDYGIVDRNNYCFSRSDGFDTGIPRDVVPEPNHGTMPFERFCHVGGWEYQTWMMNPTILLPRLVEDLREAGAAFERRDFVAEAEIRALDADIIVNCTGLGSKLLFGDPEVHPIRGQIVVLENPDRLKYMFSGCGYLFARQTDIIIGGTYDGTCDPPLDDQAYRRVLSHMSDVFHGNTALCGSHNPGGACGIVPPSQ